MFDDQSPKPTSPTASDTKEAVAKPVEDIFSSAEPLAPTNLPVLEIKPNVVVAPKLVLPSVPEQSPRTTDSIPTAPPSIALKKHSSAGKVIFILLFAFFIVALAGFLAYKMIIKAPSPTADGSTQTEENEETEESDDRSVIEDEDKDEVEDIDTDGDGLIDSLELINGTDPESTDTDKDGLGDREEVKVYGTDALNADTDEDGFLDGQEVRSGYNPSGPGKFLELPK